MKKTLITITLALATLVTPGSAKATEVDMHTQSEILNSIISIYGWEGYSTLSSELQSQSDLDELVNFLLEAAVNEEATVDDDNLLLGTSAGSRR